MANTVSDTTKDHSNDAGNDAGKGGANDASNSGAGAKPLMDEADIGSGEKPPSQLETEEMIRQIPPLQPGQDKQAD